MNGAAEEMVEHFDSAGRPAGVVARSVAERELLCTATAAVLLVNPDGTLWLQRRRRDARHMPGLVEVTAAGTVKAGENPLDAAARELLEEASVDAELTPLGTYRTTIPTPIGPVDRIVHLFRADSPTHPSLTDDSGEFLSVPTSEAQSLLRSNPGDFIPPMATNLCLLESPASPAA